MKVGCNNFLFRICVFLSSGRRGKKVAGVFFFPSFQFSNHLQGFNILFFIYKLISLS